MNVIQVCQELTKEIPSEQIYMNEPMSKHTTFKVGGNADIFVKVKNIDELKHIIKIAKKNDIHITVIGNGSNILVKDNGIRGIVAKIEFEDVKIGDIIVKNENLKEDNNISNMNGQLHSNESGNVERKNKENKNDNVIVAVGAGVKLAILAQMLLQKEITGFEFASGIPGTIGGAVKMNAGAYGSEMKDIVISTKCLDLKRYDMIGEKNNIDDIEIEEVIEKADEPDIIELSNEEQQFVYRDSIFSNKRYVILETKLRLQYGDKEEIKSKMDELLSSRREKQPNMPSAGSTFKRGEDYITAKLIDECGLKGYTIGGAQVSDKHAGFIINNGDATAQDILDLISYVKKTVYEKKGKVINLEIEVLGE